MRYVWLFVSAVLLLCCLSTPACHSYHIEATIENHTRRAGPLLEVDYPSASFGTGTVSSGDVFRYRIQTRGSGPLKVQYTAASGRQIQITGPTLYEKQEGSINIILLPDGKAEFHPKVSPQH